MFRVWARRAIPKPDTRPSDVDESARDNAFWQCTGALFKHIKAGTLFYSMLNPTVTRIWA